MQKQRLETIAGNSAGFCNAHQFHNGSNAAGSDTNQVHNENHSRHSCAPEGELDILIEEVILIGQLPMAKDHQNEARHIREHIHKDDQVTAPDGGLKDQGQVQAYQHQTD